MKLAACNLLWVACACAQPAPTDYMPPSTKMAIGINVRRLIDAAQLPDLNWDPHSLTATMLAQAGLSGLNPLKDIDSIVIASSGEGEKPPAVAILRGRFAGLKPVASKDPNSALILVDESTMLVGTKAEVEAAMQHRSGALAPALAARVTAMASRYDCWGAGGRVDNVDRFEFGAGFQDGLDLNAEFHVRPTGAQKLTETTKFLEAIMNGPKFHLEAHNGVIKLSLHVDKAELKKAMVAGLKKPPVKPPEPGKIVTNSTGETVSVTLPGGR
jgi:hypothetical protein